MKSKTSFFNRGIFWKNVTLYWPIWTIYTLLLLLCVPGQLWLYGNSYDYAEVFTQEQSVNILHGVLYMGAYTLIIAGMALVTGIALFSYLFSAKTANMIHSLPVDRNQLFGTNVISGLVFLIVPQIVTFVVSVLYCLNRGISHMEYLAIWLLMSMVTAFVAYAFVTFCSFLTGQLVTMIGLVALINFFSLGITAIITFIYDIFAFGVDGNIIPRSIVLWCSPYNAFACLDISPIYENEVYVGMKIFGEDIMLVYSVIAIILYAVSWFLYQKRHIEHAGDLLTVPCLKPVFRWGVAFCVALLIAPLLYGVFLEIGKTLPIAVFVIVFVIVGMLGYFVADMLLKKTFKVFKKAYWKQWGICSVFLAVSCIGIYISTITYENALPNKEEVAYARMSYGYNSTYEKEELDKVLAVHEAILEQKDLFEKMKYGVYKYGFDYIGIEYYDEDYSLVMSRRYFIPYNEEGISICQTIFEYEKEPQRVLANIFGCEYEDITTFGAGTGEYIYEYSGNMEEPVVYQGINFDSNSAKILYEAVIADAYAGTLYPYNTDVYWKERLEKLEGVTTQELSESSTDIYDTKMNGISVEVYDYGVENTIYLSYKRPIREKTQINQNPDSIYELMLDYDMRYSYIETVEDEWTECGIHFGSDCTNIVNALVELGLIESADVIQ